jgi:AraC family transcriptional regulator
MQSPDASVTPMALRCPVAPRQNLPRVQVLEAPFGEARQSSGAGAYGSRIASLLKLEDAPTVAVRTRQNIQIAVTRLRSKTGFPEKRTIPREPGFSIQLYLQPASAVRLWYGNRPVGVEPNRQEGSVSIIDLDKAPSIYIGSAFDILQIYMSRTALDDFADETGGHRCDTLSWPFGKIDPTLRNLGLSLLPAMEMPEIACDLYTDHLLFALRAYIARAYGSITSGSPVVRGGLAAWQKHRAVEMLRANLHGQISLAQVAAECRLSVSHFVRAFKQTLGQPPYRWLMEQRIDAAKGLLRTSRLPVADIALRCGFTDQACFIRAFRRTTQTTPGDWRRTHATAPSSFFCYNNDTSKIYA